MRNRAASTDTTEVDYVSGRTRVFGIVGDPIAQVRSPEMFSAEFRKRGRDAILVPLHVLPDDFDACLAGLMQLQNLGGLIFTIPYKIRALGLASTLGPQARVVGAINALTRDDQGWKGEIFDGLGCVEAFRRRGLKFQGQRIMLLGAGGAGAAIGVAIASQEPRSIEVFDVDQARAQLLVDKIQSVAPRTRVRAGPPHVDDIDMLLNATPVGMLDDAHLPLVVERLPRELVVFDAIVKPERTPLMQLAQAGGCRTVFGREMMLGQISRMVDYFGYLA
jgi:shikimate dehydrogenase